MAIDSKSFFEAVATNDLAGARSMLKAHPELAKAGEGQGTALHAAAKAGNLDMIRLLLEFGADVNAEAHYHESPLTFAAQEGHVEAMKLLREHGGEEYP